VKATRTSTDKGIYDGYAVYGPYGSKRKIIVLVSPGHRTTMSYARYLMSLHIGRELADDEEVDHVDDDCLNDAIDNLQILTPEQNREKQNRLRLERSLVTLTCPECHNEFTRPRQNTNLRPGGPPGPSCCSHSCSASYHNKRRKRRGVV
jgi:HNH endonuclease